MSGVVVLAVELLAELEPAIQAEVESLIRALHGKDPSAARAAFEGALRLQFEMRNDLKTPPA